MVRIVADASPTNSGMVFASESESSSALLRSVSEATELSYYIGVGGAYLDGPAVMAISKMELDHFKFSKHEENYYEIHRRPAASQRLAHSEAAS